jgi:hypothetical protein
MAGATRTQVYLTAEQRARLDELIRSEGRPLAELIREAVDAYLEQSGPMPGPILEDTFGAAPDFEVPSREEWDERDRRVRG